MSAHRRFSARPTIYNGVKMRSRLEARFAADCDERRIPWKYEPCCYADETGQYLPDFQAFPEFLPADKAMFIEIKPFILEDTPQDRVDEAMAVFGQMRIIRSSVPNALLYIQFFSDDGLNVFALDVDHTVRRCVADLPDEEVGHIE